MRATQAELREFAEPLTGLRKAIVEDRWMAVDDVPSLAGIAMEHDEGVLKVDRLERALCKLLRHELGGRTPHPVYDMPITIGELESQAALVRRGEATHKEVARRLRIGTRRARMLLGPLTKMLHGRVSHGAKAFYEHGCRCEVCVAAVEEAMSHYGAGGRARVGIEAPDLAACQESERVYYTAGHHDTDLILRYCERVGVEVDEARHQWWKKQRARLWWVDDPEGATNPVTVAAKRFPTVHSRVTGSKRSRNLETWVRRWLRNEAEDEVVSEALAPGERNVLVDLGWCDATGFPSPTKQATHFGIEWGRLGPT